MEFSGPLEVEFGGGAFAVGGKAREHGFAMGVEKGVHGGSFGGIGSGAGGRAGLVARREALVHLAVDAAGVFGIGHKVLDAVGQRAFAEAVGGVDARVVILRGEAQEEGRA